MKVNFYSGGSRTQVDLDDAVVETWLCSQPRAIREGDLEGARRDLQEFIENRVVKLGRQAGETMKTRIQRELLREVQEFIAMDCKTPDGY